MQQHLMWSWCLLQASHWSNWWSWLDYRLLRLFMRWLVVEMGRRQVMMEGGRRECCWFVGEYMLLVHDCLRHISCLCWLVWRSILSYHVLILFSLHQRKILPQTWQQWWRRTSCSSSSRTLWSWIHNRLSKTILQTTLCQPRQTMRGHGHSHSARDTINKRPQ